MPKKKKSLTNKNNTNKICGYDHYFWEMVLLTFSGVYLYHFVAMMEEVSLMIDN